MDDITQASKHANKSTFKPGVKNGGARLGSGRPNTGTRMTIQHLNILQKMEDLGYDPIKEMVSMVQDKNLDNNLKASIHKELAQYIAPKRKSVDFNVGESTEFKLEIKSYARPESDPDTVSLGSEEVSGTSVVSLGEGDQEGSGSVAPESGEGSVDDQLDSESRS